MNNTTHSNTSSSSTDQSSDQANRVGEATKPVVGMPAREVKPVNEQVRVTAQETVETAKAKAGEVASKIEQQAEELTEQAKAKASEATAQIRATAENTFDEQKERTVQQAEGIASALRQSSNELRANDQEAFAHYTDMAAEQVEYLSGYVRSKGLNDVVNDVQQLARRQPELFVAGMLAGGFLLGRFLKSSQRRPTNYEGVGGYGGNYRPGPGRQQYSPGAQAYMDYYEANQNSPYPSGGYPRYDMQNRPGYQGPQQYAQREGYAQPNVNTEQGFHGGATEFNGQRSMRGASHNSYGNDPAVTSADWGVEYQANEYGQSKAVNPEQDKMVSAAESKNKEVTA